MNRLTSIMIPYSRRKIIKLLEPHCYIFPSIILIGLFILIPLTLGITYAFRDVQLMNPFSGEFIGLAHFKQVLGDETFYNALFNTLWWTCASVIFQFMLGLGLALLLYKPFRGRGLIQALVFLPWAVPSLLMGLNWAWLFNPLVGPIPHWLNALRILGAPENILSDPALAMWGPIVANVWGGIPFFAITLLAALQSIPQDVYEAADLDGASAWQRFSSITLPYLVPTIAMTILLRTIWIANFADLIVVMTNGGPANHTQILSSYIYTIAFRQLDFGYASAVALVLILLLMIYSAAIIVIKNKITRED